jgi:anti-sigma B factor antagonist
VLPAVHEEFRCDIEPDREHVVVRPVGEVDLGTSERVDTVLQELREAGFTRIVIDRRRVTFLDSSGLRLLIAWAQGAEADGYDLGIVPDSPPVMRLLELTGAKGYLPLVQP